MPVPEVKTGLEKHTGTGEDFLTIYFNLIPGRVPPGRFLFCNLSKIVKNLLEILHDKKKKIYGCPLDPDLDPFLNGA